MEHVCDPTHALHTTRRKLLGATAALTTIGSVAHLRVPAHGAAPSAGTVLVSNGQPQVVVVLPPGTPPGSPATSVEVEAESGEVTPPMRVVTDDDSSDGAYVDSATDGPDNRGSVAITVDVPHTGTWILSGRVWGRSGTADSLTVQVDDGPVWTWHLGNDHSGWRWVRVTHNPGSSTQEVSVDLEAGPHTVIVGVRESGAAIDQLRLEKSDSRTQLGHSADQLAAYVEKVTGVRLPVITAGEDVNGLPTGRVHLGWTGPDGDTEAEQALDGLDDDGFVISAAEGVACIVGPTEWGTRYGVYEILETDLGVAWLLPGEDGEDVPASGTAVVAQRFEVQEPSFRSRTLPYLFDTNEPNAKDWASTDPQVVWATRQRTHSRITRGGNHNLFNVFPTRVYADPTKSTYRPEIYPIVDGETVLPALGSTSG